MNDRRVSLRVRGKVQGVFFRQSAMTEARRLSLRGWVKNLDDGDVLALAEGDAAAVEQFIQWCHRGPPSARVDSVDVVESPGGGPGALAAFTVEHG
jgi:acylphosphatase